MLRLHYHLPNLICLSCLHYVIITSILFIVFFKCVKNVHTRKSTSMMKYLVLYLDRDMLRRNDATVYEDTLVTWQAHNGHYNAYIRYVVKVRFARLH